MSKKIGFRLTQSRQASLGILYGEDLVYKWDLYKKTNNYLKKEGLQPISKKQFESDLQSLRDTKLIKPITNLGNYLNSLSREDFKEQWEKATKISYSLQAKQQMLRSGELIVITKYGIDYYTNKLQREELKRTPAEKKRREQAKRQVRETKIELLKIKDDKGEERWLLSAGDLMVMKEVIPRTEANLKKERKKMESFLKRKYTKYVEFEKEKKQLRKEVKKIKPKAYSQKTGTKVSISQKEIVFWDVDTQRDFMIKFNLDGTKRPLYVSGSEKIKPILKKLTDYAIDNRITRCYTLDTHNANDWKGEQLAEEMQTFPPHVIIGTEGFRKIDETNRRSNCVIRKSTYDVFNEQEKMRAVIKKFKEMEKTTIVVYGVATDYCVKSAVLGFLFRGFKVIVIKDAIAGVRADKTKQAITQMTKKGAIFMTFFQLTKSLK